MNIANDEILNCIKSEIESDVYLVGGAVRDFIVSPDKEIFDRDIIVDGMEAKFVAQKLVKCLDATFIELDAESKIYRLVLSDKKNYIDITNPIENSLEKDIKRRDLTINSLCYNIKTGEIVDFLNGKKDLENKVIKIISEKNVVDDPLRILRAYRFMSTLGFSLDKESEKILKKHVQKIKLPANERKIVEIIKLFGGDYCDTTLLKMDEIGLLNLLFPVIDDVKKVPKNSHHHLDLFHHSIETVRQIQILYEKSPTEVKKHLKSIDFGAEKRLSHLKLAGFLHDIGKFSTWTIEDNGRHRFIKHDIVGSEMSFNILRKMGFSKKQNDYISKMIKFHIYPASVVSSPDLSEKIMMRFVRKMDTNSIDVIMLSMADRLSARGPMITEEIVSRNINGLKRLLEYYISVKDTLKPLEKIISGQEIMQILNIHPSPILGKIIDEIHELQLSQELNTHEDAVLFVKRYRL